MKYLLLFLTTFLFDNSGTPLPILAASTLISAGKMQAGPAFFAIYLGLLSWDSLTFFAGKMLKPFFSRLNWKVFQKILREFSNVYISSEKILILFCKFVPWVGKATPFLAGYMERPFRTLLVIWAGDLIYESVFFFTTLTAGRVFLEFSKILGIALFAVLMVVYFLWKRKMRKFIEKH
ncbi:MULTISPECIES: DedA family protein [Thermotoga]|uniref:DedA family protein n=1 Tax=Thermotoga TaxID=2335 RepID=UPI0002E68D36|nr:MULTISPECIES: hypothetical protein [Thermotoga]HBF11736.1 hypothetical protein [Thermotoga neapolitana]